MPELVEVGRSRTEMAAERIRAEYERDHGGTDYSFTESTGVLAALSWLEGVTPVSPVSDTPCLTPGVPPTVAAVRRELLAAKRLEAASPVADRVWPSGVIRALKWWVRDPTAGY